MSFTVLLSPIHFSFFELAFTNLIHYILNSKGDDNYFLFQKTNESMNK